MKHTLKRFQVKTSNFQFQHLLVFSGYLLMFLWLCGYAADAFGQERGLTIAVKAEDDPNAPVVEKVELYDKSYALVIGIDDYTAGWPKLSNAIADAKEIVAELEKQGFEVTFVENPNSEVMQRSLKEFFALKGADPNARLLLWFAGHGHTIKGEGFLVPADAPLPTTPEFKLKAIHMRDFGGFMRLAESKHVFAIFDSCFSGTIFQTRAGIIPAAVTRATTLPVRQFLSSGDADQTVSDDGTFRKLFLQALRGETQADANGDGYLLGSELGMYLADRMTNLTEQAQTPRYGKLLDPDFDRGDFVFFLPGRATQASATEETTTEVAAKPETGELPEMVEIAFWASIAAGSDPAEFEQYLAKYPGGHFADIAKRKIETLREPQTPQVETPPEQTVEVAPLQMASDATLVKASQQAEWSPVAPSQSEKPFAIMGETELDPLFAGTGQPLIVQNKDEIIQTATNVSEGYAIAPNAWNFSDPQGDSLYKVDGPWIHFKANGGHNLWDCTRGLAPILSVNAPATESWTAQVKFELPARVGNTHLGLILWNGREERPVHALYFGPGNTDSITVAGSYRDGCGSGSDHLARQAGSTGSFATYSTSTRGWLRLSKQGDRLSFYFKSPYQKQWQELGSLIIESKDRLAQVGLFAKTWGSESVQASFKDFRLFPGVSEVKRWIPAYYGQLEQTGQVRFVDQDFSDFEWSDPQGDSVHEIVGSQVTVKANGGHNIWDCNRMLAPILSVEAPPIETWTAQVKFEMPSRIGNSHVGLVLWNGREERPVYALYFGPGNTDVVTVSGSDRDSCGSGANVLARTADNSGSFTTQYDRSSGWLRISRHGNQVNFYFKSPYKKQWQEIGSVLTTVKDGFMRIGLIAKTWGSEPVQVTFSDFTLMSGLFGTQRWIPDYFARLEDGKPEVFIDQEFSDFEWSDPQGDSFHQITGARIQMKANGGHNIWDCNRLLAPMLTVEAPPRDTWVAQVDFTMPARVNSSQVGMVLWNGSEERPTYALYFGPTNTNEVSVAGSYRDSCGSGPDQLAKFDGNSGAFRTQYDGTAGQLRIIKTDMFYRFAFKPADANEWQDLGNVETTVKDNFTRIGLIGKTWGNEPVEVEFANFTILPGVFR